MSKGKIAAFIDLQGTLGGTGIDDITDFEFYPFSIEAVKLLNENGILAIVITNQSNISRGIISQRDFDYKINMLSNQLADRGAYFDEVYCCSHTREDCCSCKKPLPGLIEDAVKKHDIDLKNSYVIGDMGMNDIVLARNAGTKGILVMTGVGKGSLSEYRHTWQEYDADYIAEDVLEAVKWILDIK
ncbi:D-glycero-alpha-D-manno-heptose-1,7-bisphosphate 7-phosphatase [Clostridium folliculivorans]|uniref:D,D-heptose 1,7-bisphosphate phosphatase n=1 Tax=Clostridium folliculivorans TaxID=2886038 RepID=A0A9W5Y502_9CLOT|nr:HAD-IIIA family hydrolase [Clostridium folliculivorans]GKU26645.1 D,D-heptose 1,7-bisphosphate phosphatase [Clostridium folliculivorans]GKU28923.1 D,D-heptose 1,7-bisphosphate phosphatase [Clostridium folliculivorans]